MTMLVADVIALGWVGMWAALSVKQLKHASGRAVGRILLLPWLFFLVAMPFVGAAAGLSFYLSRSRPEFWHAVLFWFTIGIVNNWIFAARARTKLNTQFRLRATERFQPEKPRRFWSLA